MTRVAPAVSLMLFLALPAFGAEPPATAAPAASTTQPAPPASSEGHMGHGGMMNLMSADPGAGEDHVSVSGTVVEALNGGGYTYLNIKQADGKTVWAAIPGSEVAIGSTVTLRPGTKMVNLPSKALKRTFDSIIFSDGIIVPSVPSASAAPAASHVSEEVHGKVLQTMTSGGYTYVQIQKDGGEQLWAAMPVMKLTVGQTISFKVGTVMTGFQSKSLNRTFDSIIFTDGPKTAKDGKKTSPGSTGAHAAPTGKIKVEKASGPDGHTVAELFTKKDALAGKKVTVQGKVVKVSTGIMSTNWIHVQDGTGSKAKKTNNLVVTSSTVPNVGDTVIVRGKLIKNKDFGSGYRYDVFIEKASIEIK